MPTYEEMPEDNAELARVEVDFPHLDPNTAEACPESIDELVEYLGLQVPRGHTLETADLAFLRTALVDGSRYWIWTFRDPDGSNCYATMSVNARGNTMLGYGEDYYGLTPEQFILGEYHQVF